MATCIPNNKKRKKGKTHNNYKQKMDHCIKSTTITSIINKWITVEVTVINSVQLVSFTFNYNRAGSQRETIRERTIMMAAAGFIAPHPAIRAGFFAALTVTNVTFICASATPVNQRRSTARIAYRKTLRRRPWFIDVARPAVIRLNSDSRRSDLLLIWRTHGPFTASFHVR